MNPFLTMNKDMPKNMKMGMLQMDLMDDDDWMQGFKTGVEEIHKTGVNNNDSNKNPEPKIINLIFAKTTGEKRVLKINYGTTISQALKKYLDAVGKPELFLNSDRIIFLFNATRLDFNDNRPVEVVFRYTLMPKIIVNDTQSLIGAYNFWKIF